jgi:hypothetical protein
VLFGLLAGCGAPPYSIKADPDALKQREKISLLSKDARKVLRLVEHKASRTEAGFLQVELKLQNVTKKDYWFDVQTQFLDSKGSVIDQTNFQPLGFIRGMITTYKGTSLTAGATDYVVYIRDPVKK